MSYEDRQAKRVEEQCSRTLGGDNVSVTKRDKDKNRIRKIPLRIFSSPPPSFIQSIRRALEKSYESTNGG